jgi:hypothetical protein
VARRDVAASTNQCKRRHQLLPIKQERLLSKLPQSG